MRDATAGRTSGRRAPLSPDAIRQRNLRDRFGVTVEVYNEMLERQGHVCAICRNPETHTLKGVVRALAVDHCHETGRVRGLLCSLCNTMLGMADDDPQRLRAAIDYLEEAHVSCWE
jgi:hypothetical protein